MPDKTRTNIRWSILFAMAIVGCVGKSEELQCRWTTAEDKTHSFTVAYGFRGDKLEFLALTGIVKSSNESIASIVSGHGTSKGDNWYELNRPDGTRQMLPNGTQLFEFIDGDWNEKKADVTKTELDAFLSSQASEISIKSLLEFVRSRREKNGK